MLGRHLPYFVIGLIYVAPSLMHWRGISCNSHAAESELVPSTVFWHAHFPLLSMPTLQGVVCLGRTLGQHDAGFKSTFIRRFSVGDAKGQFDPGTVL